MKKMFLILVCAFAFIAVSTSVQGQNLKAQGFYFEALDLVNADYITAPGADYEKVLDLALKSKGALGGTNEQLQYLLVKSYSELEDWKTAQIELVNYGLILNGTFESISFPDNVLALNEKEQKYMAKQYVIIEQAIANSDDGVPSRASLVFWIVLSALSLLGGGIVVGPILISKRARASSQSPSKPTKADDSDMARSK